jgi:hypothetical protein
VDFVDRAPTEQQIIRRFIKDGELVAMPAKQSKRLLVLDHIAQSFELGRKYAETEVNAILRSYHDDVATLRRYLVDEGFLSREEGRYWRTGGTVEV